MVDRVYERNASDSAPQPPADPSSGYPTSGNPAQGVPATQPGPYWYHMVTESLRRVVVEAGLTPDHEDLDQFLNALILNMTTNGDQRYLRNNENVPGGLFPPGTVVQSIRRESGQVSTTGSNDFPLSDGFTIEPKRTDTSLLVLFQYSFEATRNGQQTGAYFTTKRFTGTEYVDVSNAFATELSSQTGTSATTSLIRGTGSLLSSISKNQVRDDNGNWTIRLYGHPHYADSSETLTLYRANLIALEVVD